MCAVVVAQWYLRVDAQFLQVIVGGLFGGALDMEGDGQFGLRDPLFAIPLQLDGLLSRLADDQLMGLAKITAVLLDDLGRLDGDGAGVALGGGTGDVADGVLTLRRLVILAPVVDVLVIADDLYASANRTLNVLFAGLLGGHRVWKVTGSSVSATHFSPFHFSSMVFSAGSPAISV